MGGPLADEGSEIDERDLLQRPFSLYEFGLKYLILLKYLVPANMDPSSLTTEKRKKIAASGGQKQNLMMTKKEDA